MSDGKKLILLFLAAVVSVVSLFFIFRNFMSDEYAIMLATITPKTIHYIIKKTRK